MRTIPGISVHQTYASSTSSAIDTASRIVDFVTTFISPGATTPAWVVIDDQTGSEFDVVLKSKGHLGETNGLGDTSILIRLKTSFTGTQLRVFVYQDWSTLSHTGTNGGENSVVIPTTGTNDLWICVSEYEFVFVVRNNTTRAIFSCGSLIRAHIPPSQRGTCFATSTIGGGPDVVVPVDRDVTSTIQVGQNVWVVPQTAIGAALTSDTLQVAVPVTATTATTITLNTTDVPEGALIGLEPQNTSVANHAQGIFTTNQAGTPTSITAVTHSRNYLFSQHAPNPNTGTGVLVPLTVSDNDVNEARRGSFGLMHIAADAGFSAESGDTIRVGFNDEWKFWPFPAFIGGKAICIGPLGAGF